MPKDRINHNEILEKATDEQTGVLSALNAFSQTINQSLDIDVILNEALDNVIELLKVDGGFLRLLSEDGQELVSTAHKGFTEEQLRKLDVSRKRGNGFSWKAFMSKQVQYLQFNPEDPGQQKIAPFGTSIGARNVVVIPIKSKDNMLGTLSIYSLTPRKFTKQEIELAAVIGNQIGTAIENARLFNQVEQQNRTLAAVNTITQVVNRSLDLDHVLNDTLDKIMEIFEPYTAHIRLLDNNTQELVLAAHRGLSPDNLKQFAKRLKLKDSLSSHSPESHQVVVIKDVLTDPRTAGKQTFAERIGCRSLVTTPLYAKNKIVGNMNIRSREQNAFTAEKIRLFTSIGQQVGTAIENARMYYQLQQRTEAFSALNIISQSVNQSLDLDKILNEALEKVLDLLHVDGGFLRLLDEDKRELVLNAHRGFNPEQLGKLPVSRKYGDGGNWKTLLSDQVDYIKFNPNDSFQQKTNSFGLRVGAHSAILFPIKSKDNILGTMSIYSFTDRQFTKREIELTAIIGNQIGVAIENARLFNQVEKQNQTLAAINAITLKANQSLDIDQVLNNALDKVMELFKLHSANIRLVDDLTQELVFAAHKGLTSEELKKFAERRKPGTGIGGLATKSGEVIIVGDILTDPRTKDIDSFSKEIGCRSLAILPLYAKDKLVGNMGIRARKPRAFIKKEMQLFTSIGLQIGNAIENAKLYQEKEVTIKELNQMQAQLQHAQKMEAIGTLAGGIAHDFNNLLMGIQGRNSLMLMDTDPSHPYFEHLKGVEDYVKSAANLTNQLLAFSQGGKYEVKPTDLNKLIDKSAEMFGRTKKEIVIHKKYQEDVWAVEVDRNQIEQVMLNFYVNAWQSMPGGGELYIDTENIVLDDDFVGPYGHKSGNYVKVSVADTGVGMDEATQKKVFDPFFTTKEMGRGTGLGLASAYGIISNHQGIITVYSEKGSGTTFTIYLPSSGTKIAKETPFKQEIVTGAETILLVDDEAMIIDVGRQVLERLGYKVLTAENGTAAVDIYKEKKDHIDLVILDMVMPDMGGRETYDKLKNMKPDVQVLLSSGYSINGLANKILKDGCKGFIQKPFSVKDLSQKIRNILDNKQTIG